MSLEELLDLTEFPLHLHYSHMPYLFSHIARHLPGQVEYTLTKSIRVVTPAFLMDEQNDFEKKLRSVEIKGTVSKLPIGESASFSCPTYEERPLFIRSFCIDTIPGYDSIAEYRPEQVAFWEKLQQSLRSYFT